MSAEQNKALVRHMVDETFNRGNIGLVDEFLSPDFVEREVLPPGIPSGREGVKLLAAMLHSAFPDFQATIEDIVAEGDKVVIRWKGEATQEGAFGGIPATGKSATWTGISIFRIAEGKVAEAIGEEDALSVLQQLGVVPPLGPGRR